MHKNLSFHYLDSNALMNGRKGGGISSRRRRTFNVTLLIITMCYMYVLVGEVDKPLFFTSRGPLHRLCG